MNVTDLQITETLRMLRANSLACPDVRIVVPALEELLERRGQDIEVKELHKKYHRVKIVATHIMNDLRKLSARIGEPNLFYGALEKYERLAVEGEQNDQSPKVH